MNLIGLSHKLDSANPHVCVCVIAGRDGGRQSSLRGAVISVINTRCQWSSAALGDTSVIGLSLGKFPWESFGKFMEI